MSAAPAAASTGSAIDYQSLGSGVSNIAAGIGSLMSVGGYNASAGTYYEAAHVAGQDITETAAATALQEVQTQRALYASVGSAQAAAAANGLQLSGSSAALVQSSFMQGALAKQQVAEKGQIQMTAYEQQQQADYGAASAASAQAKAAGAAGIGSIVGGIIGIVAAFL